MATDPELKIRISAQLADLRTALNGLQRELRETGAAGQRSGRQASDGMDRIAASARRAATQFAGMVTAYAAIRTGTAIVKAADEFQKLEARLKLTTKSEQEYARARAETYRIAQDSGQDLANTVDMYTRLARSTQNLGISQDALVQVTETVSQAIALSGATSEQAASAMTQFGQALAGPKFQAEELNSIIEQTPELARAIERGLGIAQGTLKRYAQEVGLSGREAVAALLRVADSVETEFRKLPRTVSQAATAIRNDLVRMAGSTELDGLVDTMEDLRAILNDPAIIEGVTTIAQAFVSGFGFAGRVVAGLNYLLRGASDEVIATDDKILALNERLREVAESRAQLAGQVGGAVAAEGLDRLEAQLTAERDRLVAQYDGLIAARLKASRGESEAARERADASAAEAARLHAEGRAAAGAAAGAAEREKAAARARKEADSRGAQIRALIADLEREAVTHGMTAAELAQYRLAQLGASEADKARAAQLSATVKVLEDRAEAERQARKEAEQWAKREKEIAADLARIEIDLMRLRGDEAGARGAELRAQFQQLLEDIQNAPGLTDAAKAAGRELIERFIDVELADARLNALQDRVSAAVAEFDRAQQSAANRVQVGTTTPRAAQGEVALAGEAAMADLQTLRTELQALAEQDVPGARDALLELDAAMGRIAGESATGLERKLRELRLELQQLNDNVAGDSIEAARGGLSQLFQDIAEGSKTGKEALRDFARGFAQSMARIAADALSTMVVLRMLQAFGVPAGGQAGSAVVSAITRHTGGLVDASGERRAVPAMVFAAAARYHTGGIAGLAPGEVPAILRRGEEVLTENDPRHVANGGAASGLQSVRINLLDDRSNIGDYMASSDGERVLLETLERNSLRARTLLGV